MDAIRGAAAGTAGRRSKADDRDDVIFFVEIDSFQSVLNFFAFVRGRKTRHYVIFFGNRSFSVGFKL